MAGTEWVCCCMQSSACSSKVPRQGTAGTAFHVCGRQPIRQCESQLQMWEDKLLECCTQVELVLDPVCPIETWKGCSRLPPRLEAACLSLALQKTRQVDICWSHNAVVHQKRYSIKAHLRGNKLTDDCSQGEHYWWCSVLRHPSLPVFQSDTGPRSLQQCHQGPGPS